MRMATPGTPIWAASGVGCPICGFIFNVVKAPRFDVSQSLGLGKNLSSRIHKNKVVGINASERG